MTFSVLLFGLAACVYENPKESVDGIGLENPDEDLDGVDDPNNNGGDDGDGSSSDGGNGTTKYPRAWVGQRTLLFEDGCEGLLEETGQEVTREDGFENIAAACPACNEVYQIRTTPDTVCGATVSSEIYRGIIREGAGLVTVVRLDQAGGSWYSIALDDGNRDELNQVEYEYSDTINRESGEVINYDVIGLVTLE
ncbi:MAG: hypothetical protein AAFV53_34920 [Myxococcota bacterium]